MRLLPHEQVICARLKYSGETQCFESTERQLGRGLVVSTESKVRERLDVRLFDQLALPLTRLLNIQLRSTGVEE